MYKDEKLSDEQRWAKITALVNKRTHARMSVDEVEGYYKAVVADEWMRPHGVYKSWASLGGGHMEVKAKIEAYRVFDEEQYAAGAV